MRPDPEIQFQILARGTEEILPEGALLERLRASAREGRPLRVKQGFDPTAPDIHLGHTVGLRKLRQFQDLGHQVVLIVGDYTGRVGDPSGRSKTRPQLDEAQVESNARTYLEQFYRVLDPAPAAPRLPVEVHRNGEWFSRWGFVDFIRLASQYTVARLLERDDFAKRFAAQQPIAVHELMYPLMQGYDSVAVRADVELGATEQKFNLLVGRALQEAHGQAPQIAMTLPVLPGLDGVQRMSKSLGNYIGVTDAPGEMYGKVMSLPDSVMTLYWRLVTDADEGELERVRTLLADPTVNPMRVKKDLAHRIVRMYHGSEAADRAQRDFEAQFSRREVPENLAEFHRAVLEAAARNAAAPTVVEALVACGFAATRSAARRLVAQGAVGIDGHRVTSFDHPVDPAASWVLRAGRRMIRYRAGNS
uniref:Tyrosine--tRNA ligase n=1 Tax=Eiseniibacteriota bacterium TaxID=2212470 RepID=A0A832I6V2_UNCEI